MTRFSYITAALTLIAVPPSMASAEIIETVDNSAVGNWSDSSLWQGGQVPGADDLGLGPQSARLTFDAAAPDYIGGFGGNAATFTLERALHADEMWLREAKFYDQGNDVFIEGQLNNYRYQDDDGNGLELTRQGGTFHIGSVEIQRGCLLQLRSGDTLMGSLTTLIHYGTKVVPDVVVTQDPELFGDALGIGLSIDNPDSSLNLDSDDVIDVHSSLILNWDAGYVGGVDWTFRWAGEHVTELMAYYENDQIVIGTTPTGMGAFDPDTGIFYDAESDYTYIAYRDPVDADGDGFSSGEDCNDSDSSIYPGASETCDGQDNDCDDSIDEDPIDSSLAYPDADGDGYGDEDSEGVESCDLPSGFVDNNLDCNDTNDTVHPDAEEIVDGLDNDCNGEIDEDTGNSGCSETAASNGPLGAWSMILPLMGAAVFRRRRF